MDLGNRILQRRKELGMTQAELAEKMFVTRQTVSRWEAGAVYPDVQKVSELARILHVSCDYLLMEAEENVEQAFLAANEQIVEKEIVKEKPCAITRLFEMLKGKKVKLTFYDEEEDIDLFGKDCVVTGFHGNWVELEYEAKKEKGKKLLSVSSILSVEILNEE